MSRKNRKKRQRNAPQPDRARRQLEKGDAKAALKEAKACYRAEPSDDHRQLLEEAFLGRVEQLHRLKQNADARAVLADLRELRPTSPHVVERIPRLQVVIGDSGANAAELLREDPALLIQMVDEAVLDARAVIPDDGETKPQVLAVREALAAVERGEDQAAAEHLKSISKNSPLADWRLLVRGLSAFYNREDERTRKNWERLDPERPAGRIAATLLAASGMDEVEPDDRLRQGLHRLEQHAKSDPVVDALQSLADDWQRGDWRSFFQAYSRLQRRYSQSHEALIRQIADLVWKRAAREGDLELLDHVQATAPAPEMDPRWRRAGAMVMEHPRCDCDAELVESLWAGYADDVRQLPCLRETERPIAVALIHQRMARNFVQYAEAMDDPGPFDDYDEQEHEALRRRAVRHYRKSIETCPELTDSYLELAGLHARYEETKQAAGVMEKLAKRDPDCFEAALWVATYYVAEGAPDKAEPYVAAARRLRPRDPRCASLAWNQTVTRARTFAIARKFDEAHRALDQAGQAVPPETEPYTLDLLRAGIELKAKNLDAAERHIETALAKVDEPLPVWMQLETVAARMRVASKLKKQYGDRFKADIENPPSSASAGRMANFLYGMKVSQANYSGRATHERLLLRYLRRAVHAVEWRNADLRNVCRLLRNLPRQFGLLEQFVEVGLDCFPDDPHFHYWAGMGEMADGPFFCDMPEAVERLETAISLHDEGQIKLDSEDLEQARNSLSLVKDHLERSEAFAGGGPFAIDDEEDDYFEDEDYEDEDYEDEDYGLGDLSPGGRRQGLPPELDEDEMLEIIGSTMPPEIRRMLERIAQMNGLDPDEALRLVLEKVGGAGPGEPAPGQPGSGAKQRNKRTKRSRRSKASRR